MLSLTATLLTEQGRVGLDRDCRPKIVLTDGVDTYTYTYTRIVEIRQPHYKNSQAATVLLDNSDGTLKDLDFEGFTATIYDGLKTANGEEQVAQVPRTVLRHREISQGGIQRHILQLIGIPDLMKEDHADGDYSHHKSSTKTVEDLVEEIADGQPVSETLTESQELTTGGGYFSMYTGSTIVVGQVKTIEATISSLSFKLKKTGSPTGNVTFVIYDITNDTEKASKVWANASTLTTSPAWCKATLDTPVAVDASCLIYVLFDGGSVGNTVDVQYAENVVNGEDAATAEDDPANGYTDHFTESPYYRDLVYRYEYSYAGIDVFNHDNMVSYEIIFDPHGTHTGGTHATILTDSSASFKTDQLIGQVIYNTTDGSSGTITDNDATTITVASLSGGSDNQWEKDDVYEVKDSLIDTYCPADSFVINENDERWTIINNLLFHTYSVCLVKPDGKLYVFKPITGGTSYDSEYSLSSGHSMFAKVNTDALVIPNKIVVRTLRNADTAYEGSATSAASYALLAKTAFVRMSLESNAQGNSIAAAMISQLELDGQRGSAQVPINCGTELYDYIKVNAFDTQDNSRTGNVGSFEKVYKNYPNKPVEYYMTFSFGRTALKAVPGTRSSQLSNLALIAKESSETGLSFEAMMLLSEMVDAINRLEAYTGLTSQEDSVDDQINDGLLSYYTKTQADDRYAQNPLAEDLDVGSHSIKSSGTNNLRFVAPSGEYIIFDGPGGRIMNLDPDGNFDLDGGNLITYGNLFSLIKSGSYVGSGGLDHAIEHGLGATPEIVFIMEANMSNGGFIIGTRNMNTQDGSTGTVTAMGSTYFYVTDNADFDNNGDTYYFVAIG